MRISGFFGIVKSDSLRYTEKGFVEIALIKLCRPAMETNLDSVLDRIRVLEKQMEERPVQAGCVAAGSPAEGKKILGNLRLSSLRRQRRKIFRK